MKPYDELFALITQRGVHEVFGAPGEGWGIEQNPDELARFLVVCQERGVQSVLEIGTGYRAGLARFLSADMGWQVTSVDVQDYHHQFGNVRFVALVRGSGIASWDFGLYDLVIIDAAHSYDAAHDDHDIWGKHATQFIMFHDIAGLRDCGGVRDYWNYIAYDGAEMCSGYHEIIAEGDQRGGIGYIDLSEVEHAAAEQALVDFKVDYDAGIATAGTAVTAVPARKATPVRKPRAQNKPAAKKVPKAKP